MFHLQVSRHTPPSRSRTSRSDFHKKGKSFISSKQFSAIGTGSAAQTLPIELRCLKFSPRLPDRMGSASSDMHLVEGLLWKQTFLSMGRLKKLNPKEFEPFTTLNKEPYHCLSLAREYKVSYGILNQIERKPARAIGKTKEPKGSLCNCIDNLGLPKFREPITVRSIIRQADNKTSRLTMSHVPLSCVRVWWDARRFNSETVCEWLQRFGPLMFTIRKGDITMLACFDSLETAYRAVNHSPPQPGVKVSWNDVRLYNMGCFRQHENYTVESDPHCIRHLSSRREHRPRNSDHKNGATTKSGQYLTARSISG